MDRNKKLTTTVWTSIMGSLPMDRTKKLAIDEQAELWFGLL